MVLGVCSLDAFCPLAIGAPHLMHASRPCRYFRPAIRAINQIAHFGFPSYFTKMRRQYRNAQKSKLPFPKGKTKGKSTEILLLSPRVATGLMRILTKKRRFFSHPKKNFPRKKIRQSRRRCLLLQNKKGGGKDGGGGSGAGMGYNVGGLCWRGGAGGAKGEAGEKQ